MTDSTPPADPSAPGPSPLDRNLAMFGYLCLFLTVFFAGVTAFITVILAYARRGGADPISRSHYRFQIGTFWWCFALMVVGVILLFVALVLGVTEGIRHFGDISVEVTIPDSPSAANRIHSVRYALIFGAVGAGLAALATLLTWGLSVWGATRLAFGKTIGRLHRKSDIAVF